VKPATKANKKVCFKTAKIRQELTYLERSSHVVVSPWEDTNSSYGEEDKPTCRYE
jgi:hypothetical protein